MRLKDNKKGCRVKKNYSLMLYQRVMGDFSPINSEGKFTLSSIKYLHFRKVSSMILILGSV